jgi:hypothetical protein
LVFPGGTAQSRIRPAGPKYVGPDSPELTARIAAHGKLKSAYPERRQIIAALRRAGLAVPSDQTGAVLAALSAAGVFRRRASVIGTVAYQSYGGMLGIRLPEASTHTQDLDLAQFRTISVALSGARRSRHSSICCAAPTRLSPRGLMRTIPAS